MSSAKLHKIETLIDELDANERRILLEYLSFQSSPSNNNSNASVDADTAWRQFRAAGQRLAKTSTAAADSLTDAVSNLRR